MWPSYLINLAENDVRMQNSKRQFEEQNIPFERIDAVNGWKLSEEQINQVYDKQTNAIRGRAPLVPAEIGCYLSHINAWQKIAKGDAPGGFIFEDDFLAESFLGKTLTLLSDETLNWEIVKLFTFSPDAKCVDKKDLSEEFKLVEPYRVPTCLIGYGVSKRAAQHLIDTCSPFFRPVDEDQKFLWETNLRVQLVLPAPIAVGDQETVTGTIGNSRRSAKASGLTRLKQRIHELVYQISYRINLYLFWKRRKQK